jgi:Ca2+-binding EF-hand superfamily protein
LERNRTLDGNQDGQIAREEAVAASFQGVQAAGRGVFASADADKDGYLTSGEFTGKIESSAQSVFQLVDANKDGKLSEAEAASVMSSVARILGVPRSDSTG